MFNAEYTLEDIHNLIGVSSYKLFEEIEKRLLD